ncbi:hypothetical protein [Xylophilus sp. ASV27]|uniref:hypothetical protein n=1 Tax=Xylophilus sp. ASV27 TaxID=2795129 RepID=UPI0018EBA34B|nr:hypothetical protein [Xylophilus sp. ASV27]
MPRPTELAGHKRMLWLDHTAYSARLLAQGQAPWLDTAACVAWLRQAQGLLRPDVLALPLDDVTAAWLDGHPALLAAIAEKTKRGHGPLKELLAAEGLRTHTTALAVALRAAMPGAVFALALPSPRDWAAQILQRAGGVADAVDEDAVDAAAAVMAEFLRLFAQAGVDAVLLHESRVWAADEVDLLLDLYQPVANVARHYGWDWGLQWPEAVAQPTGTRLGFTIAPAPCGVVPAGLTLPDRFWQGETPPAPPPGSFDHAHIPVDAHPETVLARLAQLRER